MKYNLITNPENGKLVKTKSKRGKSIIHKYNSYNNYNQEGGSVPVIIGSVGGIMAVGGLVLYAIIKKPSDDPVIQRYQQIIPFINSIDIESDKKDIEKALRLCS